MKNRWKTLMLAMLLTGCATKEIINPQEYDATKHARIRIFNIGKDGEINVKIMDCEKDKKGIHLRPTGWFNGSGQHRIGMTQTEDSDIAQKENYTFREYVIPTDKIINLTPSHQISKAVCHVAGKPCQTETTQLCQYGPIAGYDTIRKFLIKTITLGVTDGGERRDDRASFIPKAGHQYEIKPMGCSVVLKDITEENITNVSLSPHYKCPTK